MKNSFWQRVLDSNIHLAGRIVLFALIIVYCLALIYFTCTLEYIIFLILLGILCLVPLSAIIDLLIGCFVWLCTGKFYDEFICSCTLGKIVVFIFKFFFGDWRNIK